MNICFNTTKSSRFLNEFLTKRGFCINQKYIIQDIYLILFMFSLSYIYLYVLILYRFLYVQKSVNVCFYFKSTVLFRAWYNFTYMTLKTKVSGRSLKVLKFWKNTPQPNTPNACPTCVHDWLLHFHSLSGHFYDSFMSSSARFWIDLPVLGFPPFNNMSLFKTCVIFVLSSTRPSYSNLKDDIGPEEKIFFKVSCKDIILKSTHPLQQNFVTSFTILNISRMKYEESILSTPDFGNKINTIPLFHIYPYSRILVRSLSVFHENID